MLTVVTSLIWIGLLLSKFKKKCDLLMISVLATSAVVWKYALLPDVFALHSLFLTLVFLCFLNPKILEKPWVIFFVSLSVAHHHTIIFAFPFFLYSFMQNYSHRKLVFSLVFGLASISLYFLLLYFNPTEYGSWDLITSPKKVFDHFLRREYGTFRLQTRAEDSGSWVLFFLENLIKDSWSLVLVLGFVLVKYQKELKPHLKKLSVFAFFFIIYFTVFSLLGGMSLGVHGEPVFERFLIQPTLYFFFFVLMIVSIPKVKLPKLLIVSLILNTAINVSVNFPVLNYRNNTSIEDYLKNSIDSLPKSSIYYTYGDTIGFGTYYLKDVLNLRPDIIQVHPTWGFPWSREKFKRTYPDITKSTDEFILTSLDLYKHRFYTNYVLDRVPQGMFLSFYGLNFEIGFYQGTENYHRFQCDLNYKWRTRPQLASFSEYEIGLYFDLSYGACNFSNGLQLMNENSFAEAEKEFLRALELSPFNSRYQERLCKLYELSNNPKRSSCEERLVNLLTVIHPQYYSEKL